MILVKLPVALSGRMTLNSDPVAGEMRSTRPRSLAFSERVDAEHRLLSGLHARGLRFLEIGNDPDMLGHQREQLGPRCRVLAELDTDLAHLAVARRPDARVFQVDLGQPYRGARCLDVRLDRAAIDHDRHYILARSRVRGSGLADRRLRHLLRGFRLVQEALGAIALALGDEALADQQLAAP